MEKQAALVEKQAALEKAQQAEEKVQQTEKMTILRLAKQMLQANTEIAFIR